MSKRAVKIFWRMILTADDRVDLLVGASRPHREADLADGRADADDTDRVCRQHTG